MPALDDDRGTSTLCPFLRRGNGLLKIARLVRLGKDCQFLQVWGDEVHLGAEIAHGLFCFLLQQAISTGSHHDRIKHHGDILRQAAQEVCNLGGNGGVGKHANLYRINLHIIDDGV